MKRFLQTAALSLVLALIMAFAMPALAAVQSGAGEVATVEVLAASYVEATANVNVRCGPGTGYSTLGLLPKGTKIEKLGTSGSWTIVNYNGKKAYVSSEYLKAAGSSSESSVGGTAQGYVTATTNVNVRSGPGTGYSKLGTLAKGTTVAKLGTSGSWTIINYNGKQAYVSSDYLKAASSSGNSGGSSGGCTAQGYVTATANVNVRSGPGTGYSKLGTLAKGTTVAKLGTSGSWTIINYNGKQAYVSSDYLKAASSSGNSGGSSGGSTQTGYMAATTNVNVRSGPGTNYSIIGSLYKGTIVPKLGTSGSWTKISYNGGTGYVSSQYLTNSSYSGGNSSGSGNSGGGSQSGYDDAAAAELVSIINNYRAQSGIKKLTTTDALNKAAKIRVQEIVQKFDHERPDGTMVFTVDPEHINGENIAKGSGLPTAQSAADGFMNSQGHRENAMRESFTKTGSACLRVNGVTYWVHLFGY